MYRIYKEEQNTHIQFWTVKLFLNSTVLLWLLQIKKVPHLSNNLSSFFQIIPDENVDYYFGDTYRKYLNTSTSSTSSYSSSSGSNSSSSSNPGSPTTNAASLFGSLFVVADSPTPYTDATQVSKVSKRNGFQISGGKTGCWTSGPGSNAVWNCPLCNLASRGEVYPRLLGAWEAVSDTGFLFLIT